MVSTLKDGCFVFSLHSVVFASTRSHRALPWNARPTHTCGATTVDVRTSQSRLTVVAGVKIQTPIRYGIHAESDAGSFSSQSLTKRERLSTEAPETSHVSFFDCCCWFLRQDRVRAA